MAITTQELQERYIGEVITMVELDIPNGPVLRFTPSSDVNITFGGDTYQPIPMSGSGFGSTSGEFKDAAMSISNVDQVLMPFLNQYDDLKGTKVRFFQTLSKHLNTPTKTMNESHYVISQSSFNKEVVDLVLTHGLNLQGAVIPSRIMTRKEFPSLGKYRG